MQKSILVCDQCGGSTGKEEPGTSIIFNMEFSTVSYSNVSSTEGRQEGLDFCSPECMLKWLKNYMDYL